MENHRNENRRRFYEFSDPNRLLRPANVDMQPFCHKTHRNLQLRLGSVMPPHSVAQVMALYLGREWQ